MSIVKKRLVLDCFNDISNDNFIEECTEYNIDIYLKNMNSGIMFLKGHLYALSKDKIYMISEKFRKEFNLGVEIKWNNNNDEVLM